jgi:hypothetical protein
MLMNDSIEHRAEFKKRLLIGDLMGDPKADTHLSQLPAHHGSTGRRTHRHIAAIGLRCSTDSAGGRVAAVPAGHE